MSTPAAAVTTPPRSARPTGLTGAAVLRAALAETAGQRAGLDPAPTSTVRAPELRSTLRPSALMSYRSLDRPAVRLVVDRSGLASVRGLLLERRGWDELTREDPEAGLDEIVIADLAGWERQRLAHEGTRDEMMLTLRHTRITQGSLGTELTLHLGLSDASSYLASTQHWSDTGCAEAHALGWQVLTGAHVCEDGVELSGLPSHLTHGIGVDAVVVSADGEVLLAQREDPLAREGVALSPLLSGWARLADVQGHSWEPGHTLDRLSEDAGLGTVSASTVWAGLHVHLHDGSSSLTAVVHSPLTTAEIRERWEGSEEIHVEVFEPRAVRNLLVHWRADWMAWTVPALVDAASVSFGVTGAAAVGWAAHERELGQQGQMVGAAAGEGDESGGLG